MVARVALFVALLAFVGVAVAQAPWAIARFTVSQQGYADNNANQNIAGWAYFTTAANGSTAVTITLTGLSTANPRLGVHIHQYADFVSNATANGFDSVNPIGPHWIGNGNTSYGCPETQVFPGFRAGDLGNWEVVNNAINQTKYFPATMIGQTGMASPVGLSIILHKNVDPCNGDGTQYGIRLAGGVIGVTAATAYGYTANLPAYATCRLTPTTANVSYSGLSGAVWFYQNAQGSISIKARIAGLPDRLPHSMHVHQWGNTSDVAGGLATGGHWNPLNRLHSLPGDEPRHQGDLGRIVNYDSQGILWYDYIVSSTGVENEDINHPTFRPDMYSILGRGLIFHYGQDEGCNAATTNGNAGARIAQCIIGASTSASWAAVPQATGVTYTPQAGNVCRQPTAPVATAPRNGAAAVVASFGLIFAALLALLF